MTNTGIPFDQRDGYIWIDGEIVEWKEAKTHFLNHGLHYGSCVFEGIAIYNNQIFKLKEHAERLISSAKELDMNPKYNVEDVINAIKEIVKKQGITDGYIRPAMWRGSESLAILSINNSIHFAIATWKWPENYYAKDRLAGINLCLAKYSRPPAECVPYKSKASGLYVIATTSKHDAHYKGFTEALMTDTKGNIAETTSSNVFFVINNELHTPTPDCFLNGITRQTIIELAEKNSIKVVERHIKLEELRNASDMFLTGTAAELTRVKSVTLETEEVKFELHEHTKKLHNLYEIEIGRA